MNDFPLGTKAVICKAQENKDTYFRYWNIKDIFVKGKTTQSI
jgi:hypothetical protein